MFNWTTSEAIVLPIALIVTVLLSLFISVLTRKKRDIVKRIPLKSQQEKKNSFDDNHAMEIIFKNLKSLD